MAALIKTMQNCRMGFSDSAREVEKWIHDKKKLNLIQHDARIVLEVVKSNQESNPFTPELTVALMV